MRTEVTIKSCGDYITCYPDLSLKVNGKLISREKCEATAKKLLGMNRIFKPISLLFWSDYKNNNLKNYKPLITK